MGWIAEEYFLGKVFNNEEDLLLPDLKCPFQVLEEFLQVLHAGKKAFDHVVVSAVNPGDGIHVGMAEQVFGDDILVLWPRLEEDSCLCRESKMVEVDDAGVLGDDGLVLELVMQGRDRYLGEERKFGETRPAVLSKVSRDEQVFAAES